MDAPNPLTVLVVDDHKDSRFLINVLLSEHEDIRIVGEADGARSALEMIESADPDVVLLDNRMPIIDGLQAAPMILRLRPEQKIILLTAVVDDTIQAKASAAGITSCLSKEHFDDLAGAVRAVARP